MDEALIKILSCPLHREAELNYEKKYFICSTCKRVFKIISECDIKIPDFLINPGNLNRGYRDLRGSFLKRVQGKPFIRGIEEGKLVLDVGCGENPRGDINVDCYLPRAIPTNFILANAEFLPFKNNSVDIAISNYSIEHTINPAIFIQSIYAIAKEKVEIVTDNSEWLGDIFFRLYGEGRIFHDEHYYKWSVEYFTNLLNNLGYTNNKVYLTNLSNSPIVKATSLLGKVPRLGNLFFRDLKAEIRKK